MQFLMWSPELGGWDKTETSRIPVRREGDGYEPKPSLKAADTKSAISLCNHASKWVPQKPRSGVSKLQPQPHVSQHSYERDQTGLETMTMSYFNLRRLDTSGLELLHKISVLQTQTRRKKEKIEGHLPPPVVPKMQKHVTQEASVLCLVSSKQLLNDQGPTKERLCPLCVFWNSPEFTIFTVHTHQLPHVAHTDLTLFPSI